MQWDGGPNAGFCPPDVEPWLPVGDDRDQVNVATERDDPASSLHLVRRLLALRRRRTALTSGAYRRRQDAADGCLVFQRGDGADALTVAANFAATVRDIPVDATATADPRVLVATGAVELDARGDHSPRRPRRRGDRWTGVARGRLPGAHGRLIGLDHPGWGMSVSDRSTYRG